MHQVRWTRRTDVAAAKVNGVSTRLPYLLWVIASCLIAGCAASREPLRVYCWDAMEGEVLPDPEVPPLYGSPWIPASPFGDDVVAGVNLNIRPEAKAIAAWADYGEEVHYSRHYYDRQSGFRRHRPFAGTHFRRTFRSVSRGALRR